jgi:hypothetical protein
VPPLGTENASPRLEPVFNWVSVAIQRDSI